jgi:outer membrane protein assembly factor BamB
MQLRRAVLLGSATTPAVVGRRTVTSRMRSLKRAVNSCIVAAMAFTTACTTASPPHSPVRVVSGAWPMYQGRPDHNAVIETGGAAVSWKYDTKAKVNSGLAIVDGIVFLDTFDHHVLALDARSGEPLWQATSDNIIMSTPIVAGDKVFIGTGHNGAMHGGGGSFAYAVPHGRDEPEIWGRDEGDHLVAFDAATGKQLWTYRTRGEDMPSPAYADGKLIFANGDSHAYGLSAKDGSPLWRRDLSGISTMASATSLGNVVLLSSCGRGLRGETVAVEAGSGKLAWSAPYGDCDSSPTYAGGRVFVTGVDGNKADFGYGGRGYAAALDARSGHPIWKYVASAVGPFTRTGSNERAIAGTYAAGTFFASLPESNEILALDAATGRLRWALHTTGPVKMSPVIKSGKVYFGDTAGLLYVVDSTTGHLRAIRMYEAPFATTPFVMYGNTGYFVNGTQVYAVPVQMLERRQGAGPV